MASVTLADVQRAESVLRNVIKLTPVVEAETLSNKTGYNVFLKLENLQRTNSFKIRGAYNKLLSLYNKGSRKVVTASAGNHAQGVALAAKLLGMKATLVMPTNASIAKIEATRRLGAEIILHGENVQESHLKALEIAKETSADYIHAYNDPEVIAGQGTVGLEVVSQVRKLDAVVVGVGGGGLISGIGVVVKSLRPDVEVIGVEPEGADSLKRSLERGELTAIEEVDTIADGLAVKMPGELTFELAKKYVDEIVLVSDSEIIRAIFELLDDVKILAEGAGAAPVAALLSGKLSRLEGKNVLCVVSGGNLDISLLDKIILEGLVKQQRLLRFRLVIPDRPGLLKRVAEVIASERANIYQVAHTRGVAGIGVTNVLVDFEVEVSGKEHAESLLAALRSKGFNPFPVLD